MIPGAIGPRTAKREKAHPAATSAASGSASLAPLPLAGGVGGGQRLFSAKAASAPVR